MFLALRHFSWNSGKTTGTWQDKPDYWACPLMPKEICHEVEWFSWCNTQIRFFPVWDLCCELIVFSRNLFGESYQRPWGFSGYSSTDGRCALLSHLDLMVKRAGLYSHRATTIQHRHAGTEQLKSWSNIKYVSRAVGLFKETGNFANCCRPQRPACKQWTYLESLP